MRGFITSIIIFYSKKLVYHIDTFFNTAIKKVDVECSSCGAKFKSSVLDQIGKDECLYCNSKLNSFREENTFNEQRNVEYRRDQW